MVSEKKIFLVFPIVSLWDLSVAMETTILIQSAPKPNAINPPTQLWFTLNLIKIGLLASEIFFFEIVDGRTDGRTDGRRTDDDGRRMPAYPISSPVSLRLRWAKNFVNLALVLWFMKFIYINNYKKTGHFTKFNAITKVYSICSLFIVLLIFFYNNVCTISTFCYFNVVYIRKTCLCNTWIPPQTPLLYI